jgi:hypothetical protein
VDKPGKNVVVKETGTELYEVLGRALKSTVRDVRKEKERELGR